MGQGLVTLGPWVSTRGAGLSRPGAVGSVVMGQGLVALGPWVSTRGAGLSHPGAMGQYSWGRA